MSVDDRVSKRQKVSNGEDATRRTRRRIFAPYRTIGLVSSTSVPLTTVPLGKTTFQITTSIGHSLQTYDLRKGLQLVFITRPQTPALITASVTWKDKVIAAWSDETRAGVWTFKRGKKIDELELPSSLQGPVTKFCVFGSWIVGLSAETAIVWNSSTLELHTELRGTSSEPFSAAITSLPTFLNKVLIGRQDGSAEIWNVSSGKLVYTILSPTPGSGKITALEPTPALSLVAIAYENGQVVIHDFRADQHVIVLNAGEGVPVTSISFRTDGIGAGEDGQQPGAMATASIHSGDITLWDLNGGGRRAGVLRTAHLQPVGEVAGGVTGIQFLPGQAILVSSGLDNSLKTWVFNKTPFNPVPDVLHQRGGHGADITHLQFLPTNSDGSEDTGKWLMSGSHDRTFWGWSLRRDNQNTELSQGAVQSEAKKKGLLAGNTQRAFQELRCPPVTAIACSMNRDGGMGALAGKLSVWKNSKGGNDAESSAMTGWESIVTAHKDDNRARTWIWGRKRAGRWAFPTRDGSDVSAVAMSPCGTFALVGSKSGSIAMFNLQSGKHRQDFPARLTKEQAKQHGVDLARGKFAEEVDGKQSYLRGQGRHRDAVVGLAVDEINKTVISAGSGGKVKFWDFRTGLLEHELDWSFTTNILGMSLHRGANLAAITCSDLCIRVIDITTYKLIRELRIPRKPSSLLDTAIINHCSISKDARWVVASFAQLVLVWDLATGHLIDALKLRETCTGLDMSYTGEYLAVATKDQVGVEIWSNTSLFAYTATRQLSDEELCAIIEGEAAAVTTGGSLGLLEEESVDEDDEDLALSADMDDLASDMLSLSVVPRSRWQNLLNLDLIRERNRPTEAPKKPEKAPFFLPAVLSKADKPKQSTVEMPSNETDRQRFITSLDTRGNTFTQLLSTASSMEEFAPFLDHLKELNPAAADIEIRSLSTLQGELQAFVQALIWLAHQRKDFELGQAWMAVFLRVHGEVVRNDVKLRAAVLEWRQQSTLESQRVQKLAEYCGGLVTYLRAARV